MGDAKRLEVKPISATDANKIVKQLHYSGKVAVTSKLHLGVFLDGKCGGAMQFGDPIDKRKLLPLVKDTPWNGFLELNRMAFAEWLPRNGESRALGFAMRWIKSTYAHIQWVVSFADGCQCGDGTIYRASGFKLTNIVPNKTMWRLPSGEVIADLVTRQAWNDSTRKRLDFRVGETWKTYSQRIGAVRLEGFQLRYIYFTDRTAQQRLTVPILPFSEIARRGAGMYKGKSRVTSADSGTSTLQVEGGGAIPTVTL